MNIEGRGGGRDQRQTDAGAPIAGGGRVIDQAPAGGQRGAGEQFERPGEGQIERRDRMTADQRDVEGKRRQSDDQREPEQAEPQLRGQHQDQRPDQVKLFLDAERP